MTCTEPVMTSRPEPQPTIKREPKKDQRETENVCMTDVSAIYITRPWKACTGQSKPL
jgi:hypothetical protein